MSSAVNGSTTAASLLTESFGSSGAPIATLSVPGRVNLIGEHIDYHDLAVLPVAIQRHVQIAFRPRRDRRIRVASDGLGMREFEWTRPLQPSEAGDWINYIKAAANAVDPRWHPEFGMDAAIVSDLPAAAGLSSSSAVLTAATLALLRANGINASFEELMDVLPDGEQFVGTRGGGMDHAAVLGARPGCALLINFNPVTAEPVPIPEGWRFLVAHSLVVAEKSAGVKAEYNSRRMAGTRALEQISLGSYRDLVATMAFDNLLRLADDRLIGMEHDAFVHVAGEGSRVRSAVVAMQKRDMDAFGRLMVESHESARDLLRISCPALDEVVELAMKAGAKGARLTGAGFGGFVVILCDDSTKGGIGQRLLEDFYATKSGFDPNVHLFEVQPSAGALFA